MKTRLWGGRLPILALLAAALVAGLLTFPDYGASWDEPNLRLYAGAALNAYSPVAWMQSSFRIEDSYGPTNHRYYGPFYIMAARLMVRALSDNPFGWTTDNLWHLAGFLTFLAGAYALWSLCRRMAGPAASLTAVALFLTQPLLWGHAMVNPKDSPFMVSLLIAVASGLAMVDRAASVAQPVRIRTAAVPEARFHRITLLAAALSLYAFFLLLQQYWPLRALIQMAVETSYADPNSLVGQLFHRFAASSAVIPAEAYVEKASRWLDTLWRGSGLIFVFFLAAHALNHLWRDIRASLALLVAPGVGLVAFLAALALGLSTAVRLLAPLAGVLVAVYALVRLRARALGLLILYGIVAVGVCIAAWPFLWLDPIGNFREALAVMSHFPDPFQVRLNGQFFSAQELPPIFLPEILGITLTIPAIVVALGGMALAILDCRKDHGIRAILLVWFLLPFISWMVWRPPLYDNGRQYLFILPAAFALASLPFDRFFSLLAKRLARRREMPVLIAGLTVFLVLLPGILAGIQLHPYQYSYYNALAGGQKGAFRRYEVDYWLTSYKEAVQYLNKTAPRNSSVVLYGSVALVDLYANPDFHLEKYISGNVYDADYALLTSRSDMDLLLYPDAPVIFTVGRSGAVYAVIKRLR